MNKKKELAKNTVIIFFGRVCTQLISFFLLPLYTSYLSTSEYGTVDLIQTYVTLLVPIITLELEMSIFRYLIDCRGKEKDTKKLVSNNFFILGVSLFIFSILYIIISSFVTIPYRWVIMIDIIVCVLSGNFLQVARGFGKTLDYAISCILTGLTTVISNIILICFVGMQAEGMIISMALANFVCSLYLFIRLKLYNKIDFKIIDFKQMKEMFKYSLPLIPNGISWWIINVSDRSIISFVLGASANGLYAISNKFPTIISSLTGVFNLSWSESAALHINSKDRDEFFSDITRSFIKPHDICVGKRSYNDTDFSGTAECSVISKNETVGLIQTNEYLYASIDTGCKSGNSPECGNYNYLMNISSNMDTQIACTENSYQFYSIDSGTLYAKNASSRVIVYPVIYLSNDVLYKSGNGTQNNPYVLR